MSPRYDDRAFFQKPLANGATDAASGAGYQIHPAIKLVCHSNYSAVRAFTSSPETS